MYIDVIISSYSTENCEYLVEYDTASLTPSIVTAKAYSSLIT